MARLASSKHRNLTDGWQCIIWRRDTGAALQPLSSIESAREVDLSMDEDGKYTSIEMADGSLFYETDYELTYGPWLEKSLGTSGQFELKRLLGLQTGMEAAAKVQTAKPLPPIQLGLRWS